MVAILLFSPIALSVSADVIEDFDMYLNYSIGYTESSDSYVEIEVEQENYFKSYYAHEPVANVPMDRACLLRLNSSFYKPNKSAILKAGEKFNITLRGLFLTVEVLDQLHYWDKTPDRYYFELIHPDGTTTVLGNVTWSYSSGSNSQTITASGITTKEVIRIDFHQYIRQFYITDVSAVTAAGISIGDSVNPTYVSLTVQSEEAGLLEDIGDELSGVNDKLEDQGEKLDQLPDKIGDEFESVIDQEKEESKQEGNKFVDQVLDKLPDPSQGVLSALGELTAAVGYTGTEAIIPIPRIVVPAIDGLFNEIVLYEGSELDIGEYLYFIPEDVLIVIQSLFTIAIVLYCVYELKGVISFIFTLKEKNNG